jgi:hypothetical protein
MRIGAVGREIAARRTEENYSMVQRCLIFATLLSCLLLPGAARADMLLANFTILNGSASPSGGQVTFTLNGDGTIAASMVSAGDSILGFGFDSAASDLPESNFSTAPDNADGWGDLYGDQPSGFRCGACGTTETWTIGTPGEFTSVFQALDGNSSSHPFFFVAPNLHEWAADVAAVTTPEPFSLLLLGTLLLVLAPALRRKSQRPI